MVQYLHFRILKFPLKHNALSSKERNVDVGGGSKVQDLHEVG